jgi:hypothetical protein
MTRTAIRRVWTPPAVLDRSTLVMGVDKPDASNTGVLPGVSRTTTTGNITLSTNGAVLENRNVNGRVIVTAANCIIRNCYINGGSSTPAPLVECYSGSVVNCQIIDCEIGPTLANAHWNWQCVTGHDFTVLRCNLYRGTDNIGIFKTSTNGGGSGVTYNCGVTVQQSWLHDLAWWTASTTGVVHPSDTEDHSDLIQIQGGTHAQILGNTMEATSAHQYAHWWTVGNSETEPYNFIAAQSLPAGAPYYGGPYQGGRAYLFPDRGTGNNANGRYNTGQLAALMINRNVGHVHSLNVTDNWMSGGDACINGGLTWLSGENLGTFYRNKFGHNQGLDGGTPGGNNTYTVLIDSSYVGHVDGGVGGANKNYYEDNLVEINFRITG